MARNPWYGPVEERGTSPLWKGSLTFLASAFEKKNTSDRRLPHAAPESVAALLPRTPDNIVRK